MSGNFRRPPYGGGRTSWACQPCQGGPRPCRCRRGRGVDERKTAERKSVRRAGRARTSSRVAPSAVAKTLCKLLSSQRCRDELAKQQSPSSCKVGRKARAWGARSLDIFRVGTSRGSPADTLEAGQTSRARPRRVETLERGSLDVPSADRSRSERRVLLRSSSGARTVPSPQSQAMCRRSGKAQTTRRSLRRSTENWERSAV